MNKTDLQYDFPEELIATEPQRPSRICSALGHNAELFSKASEASWEEFLSFFQPGDVLVLNNTKVLKRRVFTQEGLEILFLGSSDLIHWEVLFPSKRYKIGNQIALPGNIQITLLEKGRPQRSKPIKC